MSSGDVVITPKEIYHLVQEVQTQLGDVAAKVDTGVAGIEAAAAKADDHEKRIRALEKWGTVATGLFTLFLAALAVLTRVG